VNELRYLGGETCKLFCVERVGARLSENAGAELEENAPGFSGHAKQLSKPENEGAQEYLVRRYEHNYFRGWVVGTQRQENSTSAISLISRTVAVWVKPTESFTLRTIHLFQQQQEVNGYLLPFQLAAAGVVAKVISAFLCFHGACEGNRLSRRSHRGRPRRKGRALIRSLVRPPGNSSDER